MAQLRKVLFLVLIAVSLAACGGAPSVPSDARSVHFDTVTEHLDIGGEVFVYVDLSEDIEKLTEAIAEVVDEARKTEGTEGLSHLDIRALIAELGLNPVDAVGLSSYVHGELYHNRSFVFIDGPREGLLTTFGGDPHPFDVLQMAPSDADLVFESDINFQMVYEMVLRMIERIKPGSTAGVRAELDEPMAPLSLTPNALLAEMDTRLFGVVQLRDDKKISLPDPPMDLPFVDFVFGLDRLAFVAKEVGKLGNEIPVVKYSESQNWQIVEPTIPLGGPVAGYAPVLVGDTATGRLFIASSMDYLKRCITTNGSLVESEEFKEAFYRLPRTGNSMSYLSGHLSKKLTELIGSLAGHDSQELQASARVAEIFVPQTAVAQGGVSQNQEHGVFAASNTVTSHKATLTAAAFANPLVMGTLAAVAVPAFINYMRRAKTSEATINLDRCAEGVVAYYDSHDRLPGSADWTPSTPPSDDKYPLDLSVWSHSPWIDLGFSPFEDHYFQYSLVVEKGRFVCRAQGDLDGDGEFSLFERAGIVVSGQVLLEGELSKTNPLE